MSEPEEPTIDWLIDQLCPESSPLVDFNKNRLKQLITERVIAELELARKSPHFSYLDDRLTALGKDK